MLKIEKTVFISYRRTNIGFALAIHQNLTSRGYDVFFDYESIGAGDFEQIILKSIESRAHFIVILTPSALERCKEPADWLRREIEHALGHKRNIIPLTFEGFDFKDMARYLPDYIATPLSRYNGLRVPSDYFSEAMSKLTERLNIPLEAVLHPPSVVVQKEESRQQAAIATEPQVSESILTAGEIIEQCVALILNGQYSEALKKIDDAIALDLNSAEAYACRARAKNALQMNAEALADVDQALRLQPTNATAYYARGNVKRDMGDYDGALTDYSEAIRHNPKFSNAYSNRGIIREYKGNYADAIADYDQALLLDPNNADAYNNRGIAKKNNGDYDGAIVDYTRSIDLKNPQLHLPYNNRGNVKRSMGNFDDAIADYDQALRLKPDYAEAYCNRGVAKQSKGDYDGALLDYEQALLLKPDYARAYNNRGDIYRLRGNFDQAIADTTRAIELEPNEKFSYVTRGETYIASGHYDLALSDLEQALSIDPNDTFAKEQREIALGKKQGNERPGNQSQG